MADNWLHVAPSSGGSGTTNVNITADTNSTNSQRTAIIYFKAGKIKKTVRVVQGAAAGTITVSINPAQATLDYNTTVVTLTATISGSYEGTPSYSWSFSNLPSEVVASNMNTSACTLTYSGDVTSITNFTATCTVTAGSVSGSGTGSITVEPKSSGQMTVSITPTSATIQNVGDDIELTAITQHAQGSVTYSWATSDVMHVRVEQSGANTAVAIYESAVDTTTGVTIYVTARTATQTATASSVVTIVSTLLQFNPTISASGWTWDEYGSGHTITVSIGSPFTTGMEVREQSISPRLNMTPLVISNVTSSSQTFSVYPTTANEGITPITLEVTLVASKTGYADVQKTLQFTHSAQSIDFEVSADTIDFTADSGETNVYAKASRNGFTYDNYGFNPYVGGFSFTPVAQGTTISKDNWTYVGKLSVTTNSDTSVRVTELQIDLLFNGNTMSKTIEFTQAGTNHDYSVVAFTLNDTSQQWEWSETGVTYKAPVYAETNPSGYASSIIPWFEKNGEFEFNLLGSATEWDSEANLYHFADVYAIGNNVTLRDDGDSNFSEQNTIITAYASGTTGTTQELYLRRLKPAYAITAQMSDIWNSGQSVAHNVTWNDAAAMGGTFAIGNNDFNTWFNVTGQTGNQTRVQPKQAYWSTLNDVQTDLTVYCHEISGGTYDEQEYPPIRIIANTGYTTNYTPTLCAMTQVYLICDRQVSPGEVFTSCQSSRIANGWDDGQGGSNPFMQVLMLPTLNNNQTIQDLYIFFEGEEEGSNIQLSGYTHFDFMSQGSGVNPEPISSGDFNMWYYDEGTGTWQPAPSNRFDGTSFNQIGYYTGVTENNMPSGNPVLPKITVQTLYVYNTYTPPVVITGITLGSSPYFAWDDVNSPQTISYTGVTGNYTITGVSGDVEKFSVIPVGATAFTIGSNHTGTTQFVALEENTGYTEYRATFLYQHNSQQAVSATTVIVQEGKEMPQYDLYIWYDSVNQYMFITTGNTSSSYQINPPFDFDVYGSCTYDIEVAGEEEVNVDTNFTVGFLRESATAEVNFDVETPSLLPPSGTSINFYDCVADNYPSEYNGRIIFNGSVINN